jgi:hypothetical protein
MASDFSKAKNNPDLYLDQFTLDDAGMASALAHEPYRFSCPWIPSSCSPQEVSRGSPRKNINWSCTRRSTDITDELRIIVLDD